MTVLDRVREGLRTKHPELRFESTATSVVVHAPVANGFAVSIGHGLGITVAFDGWHEHFDDEENALNCFAFGFSERCRIKVHFRGKMACKWTLESVVDGEWVADSTTALLFIPFWRRERIEYRQNAILKTGETKLRGDRFRNR